MTTQPLHGMRILVVEDEYYMADDLVRALEAAGAIPVGPFGTLHQAEDAVDRDGIHAAILDLNLHGERTDDLVKRLDEAKVPILIVSGYSQEALPPELNHVKRLEKPVSCRAIVSALDEEVSRSSA